MKRILILGSGGAGKSTLARRIGDRTGLPVVHLDAEYWLAGWREPSKEEWKDTVRKLAAADEWVMDGNFGGTIDLRIPAADTIIFLDLPRWICLWRVLRRRITYHGKSRPDMADGCREKIDREFLEWIWKYPRSSRPRLLEKLKALAPDKRLITLTSQKAVREFERQLGKNGRDSTV